MAREYYDHYQPGRLAQFDLILACGDLKKEYLEFLVTMARCPLLYVRGNHDDGLEIEPPEGCLCIEDQLYVYQGVRILGLGGSYRYRPGHNMYTEGQMRWRVLRRMPEIWRRGGIDILVTHAPARHVNDFDNATHRGFECFTRLLDRYRPRYFVHGHIHKNYGLEIPERSVYHDTTVLNASGRVIFEY